MKTKIVVRRFVRGWDTYQLLIKQWFLFGFKVWSKVLDREDIPQHVHIQYLTMGDWHGFRSKFYDYIEAEKKEIE